MWTAIEIIAVVSGAIYVLMQITQYKLMWFMNIITGAANAAVYFHAATRGLALLNIYYIVMSLIGIVKWYLLRRRSSEGSDRIYVCRLSPKVALLTLGIVALAFPVVFTILATTHSVPVTRLTAIPLNVYADTLRHLSDVPVTVYLDSVTVVLSVVATWWLARSYKEQWIVWFVADTAWIILNVILIREGQIGISMLFLPAFYIISCIVGFTIWSRKGIKVEG